MRYFKVYLWLLTFLRPYKVPVFFLILSGLLISLCELAVTKFIQIFIDDILPEKDMGRFRLLLLGIVFICMLYLLGHIASNMLQRIIREKPSRDIQFMVFRKLRELGFSYYEKNPVGRTLSMLNTEVAAVQNVFKVYIPWMIQDAMFVVVSLIILLTIHIKLTMIIVPCFVIYSLIGPFFEKRAANIGKISAQCRIDVNQQIYESISSVKEIRAFGREEWSRSRFASILSDFIDKQMKTIYYIYSRATFRRICVYSGGIAIFLYSAVLIKNQELTIGGFVTFALLYFFTTTKMTEVLTAVTEQRLLMYQSEVLFDFIHTNPYIQEVGNPVSIPQVKGEIAIRNVYFGYDKDTPILKGIDLYIKPGERIALVGGSGNGKSTILKLLGRFYDPDHGEIDLDGVSLRELSLTQVRESTGFIFQEIYLFGGTVRENILFGNPDATEEQMITSAKAAYAHDFILRLSQGYETVLGERGVVLSGGQKQRISLARLFLKNPKILLLDEATSALDNVSESEVKNALEHLFANRTTISVAHRLSTIQDYDRIAVLEHGKIAECGTYEELMDLRGVFYALSMGETKKVGR